MKIPDLEQLIADHEHAVEDDAPQFEATKYNYTTFAEHFRLVSVHLNCRSRTESIALEQLADICLEYGRAANSRYDLYGLIVTQYRSHQNWRYGSVLYDGKARAGGRAVEFLICLDEICQNVYGFTTYSEEARKLFYL